jgi:hypothetical protein
MSKSSPALRNLPKDEEQSSTPSERTADHGLAAESSQKPAVGEEEKHIVAFDADFYSRAW